MKRILSPPQSRSCHGLPKWGLIRFLFFELALGPEQLNSNKMMTSYRKLANLEQKGQEGAISRLLPPLSHLYCRLILPRSFNHSSCRSFIISGDLLWTCSNLLQHCSFWTMMSKSKLQTPNEHKILEVQLHITIRATWMKGSSRNYHGWKCNLQPTLVITEIVCKTPKSSNISRCHQSHILDT